MCHYDGKLITAKEAKKRSQQYDESQGSYMFFFEHNGGKFWLVTNLIGLGTSKHNITT